MKKLIDDALMDEYLAAEMGRGFKGPKWEKYFRDKVEWLGKLSNGLIFVIEKPSIETSFCFGESGYDYDDANKAAAEARSNENLFRIRNLRWWDERVKALENGPEPGDKFWVNHVNGYGVASYLNIGREWDMRLVNCETFEIAGDDLNLILDGYKAVRDRFAKRVDAYLKRYGLSKVHAWTYWRDA